MIDKTIRPISHRKTVQALTKDSKAVIDLKRRKHIQKEKIIDMINDLNDMEFTTYEKVMNDYYVQHPHKKLLK